MRAVARVSLCLAAAIALAGAPAGAQRIGQRPLSDSLRRDMNRAREKVYPALVNITVVYRYFDGGRALRSAAGGSGVIISRDGYVITNFHVAGHTTRITCTLPTGESLDAGVVCDDPLSDLSVLKLRLDRRPKSAPPLHYATLGNSDALKVGDFVLAMGNPLMLSSSMTLGIVSNPKRVFTDFTGTAMEDVELEEGEKTGLFTRWIQHDALILPGNSGGPLVNLQGQVVGINELGGEGVGFAIPSNLVAAVFEKAVRYGRVPRGWLGVNVFPVQKLGRQTGALVSAVLPGSPAARAGLKPGDILLSLDGAPIAVRFFEEVPLFYLRVANLPAGHLARIRLLRQGQPLLVTAVVAPMKPLLDPEEEFRSMGVTVRNVTEAMALAQNLPEKDGVYITGVRPGYPFEAAEPKLQEGDVVREVDGRPTPDIAAFRRALAGLDKSKPQFAVTFQRKDERMLTVVKTDTQQSTDQGGELPKAWIGIKTQVLVPEIAAAEGIPQAKGFLITRVYPWTEASKAGLQTGDVITALNGSALDASRPQDAQELTHAVEDLDIGKPAQLTVLRRGAAKTLSVMLERSPDSTEQAKTARSKELEFTVREINLMDRAEHHWSKDQPGLLVTEATNGGWANIAGLHIDDLVVSINGQMVGDTETFERVMRALVRQRPRRIQIFVRRDYLTQFIFIEPDWTRLLASQ
ncbi:MAG TPA: PDZ domain-containing protein [Chthonomonadaceae bacterium]|nr:PDZ domain-containing protein [Chthonomonadaceae bacterium]